MMEEKNGILSVMTRPAMERLSSPEKYAFLLDPFFFDRMEEKKDRNEKERKHSFEGFTDLEVIYYFIHLKKDLDDNKNRKGKTKREYFRDLLSFYKHLIENEAYIRDDVHENHEPSLLKLLKKRHIKYYQEWLSQAPLGRKGQPYSVATLARKTVVIKSFLKWLYEVGYIKEDITQEMKSSNISKLDRPNRDLYYHEVKQILDFYKGNIIVETIILLLATTGLRVAEVANSKFKDLYYDHYTKKHWLKVIGKNNKPREALIFDNVFEKIIQFRARRGLSTILDPNDNTPLLTTNKGKAYSPKYLSQFVIDKIKETNLSFLEGRQGNISPHFFRHYFAIQSWINGADIYLIQKTLDHESIKTTEIYLEKTMKKENNAALKWDETIF